MAHASAATLCKRTAMIAWRMVDVLREYAELYPSNGDERELVKNVKLQTLILV
jgi:hypothetical protein